MHDRRWERGQLEALQAEKRADPLNPGTPQPGSLPVGQHGRRRCGRGLCWHLIENRRPDKRRTVRLMRQVISLEDVRLTFPGTAGEVVALDEVDLEVAPGQVCGVLGGSGAGKTALLRVLCMLNRPSAGTVRFAGHDLTTSRGAHLRAVRRLIGLVPSTGCLLSRKTVAQNVAYPLLAAGVSRQERDLRTDALLHRAGLAALAHARPGELTAADQRRVALARATISRPSVVLVDESRTWLDLATRRLVARVLREYADMTGAAAVLVTHDAELVKEYCDVAVGLDAGRVVEAGPVAQLLASPRSELGARLFPQLPRPRPRTGQTLVDLTFAGDGTQASVLTELVQTFGADVSIVAGDFDTIAGRRVGRLRVEVGGQFGHHDDAVRRLAQLGLTPRVHQ